MNVGRVLRLWRDGEGFNVRVAAEMIGISPATLSRIENGKTVDGHVMFRLIAFLFDQTEAFDDGD